MIKQLSNPALHRRAVVRLWSRDGIARASDLAFTTSLALVPMLGLLISLFSFDTLRELNVGLESAILRFVFPHVHAGIEPQVLVMLEQARRLQPLGIVFAFLTSMFLFHTVASNFDFVWDGNREPFPRGLSGSERTRYVIRRLERYVVMFLFLYCGLAFSFWLTGELKELFRLETIANHKILTAIVSELVAAVVALVALGILFKGIPGQPEQVAEPRAEGEPGQQVSWNAAIVGALVSALIWELVKIGFYAFFVFSPTYRTLYGPFMVVPAALIWLFVTWLVILYGLSVASVLQADRDDAG